MPRVFISYAREDGREFAEDLVAKLPGHDVWLDRRKLAPGVDWLDEIETAIDSSEVFLAVLTRAYGRAEFARLELARAWGKRKPILPLRFDPQADSGTRLLLTQWIDFTDPAAKDERLRLLMEQIELLAQGGSMAARDLRAGRWDAVQARTAAQSREVTGNVFRADLYVRREAAEQELVRFLESSAAALLLIGDAGAGKTSLLSHWTLELLGQGHAVLLYDCSALADADVEEEIARDLGMSRDEALEEIEAAAAQAAKKVFFVFDSIGDYRGTEQNGAQVLLRSINRMAGRIRAEHARVIASCNTATWSRLLRVGPLTLGRGRYFRSGDEPFLRLGPFTDAERDEAYNRYRNAFGLSSELGALPHAIRERLREPVLLRLTAEVHGGSGKPLLPVHLGIAIDQAFFEERVLSNAEQALVDQIAQTMVEKQNSALSMEDVKGQELLRNEILPDDPLSSYGQLLDRGVLQELRDLRAGFLIRFAHTRLAAYAIARHFLRRPQTVAQSVEELLGLATEFPLAWDAALALLRLSKDASTVAALARSHGVDHRELAVQALVALHAEDAPATCTLLQTLIDEPSEEGRRTALKAAYHIGPEARDFFLRAAIDGAPSMRDSLKNTLYLIWRNESDAGRSSVADTFYLLWRHAPGFTYALLGSLLAEIRLWKVAELKAIVGFVVSLVMTIYVNHCDDEEVLDRTTALIHELTVERLPFRLLAQKPMAAVFVPVLTRYYGKQILSWIMFSDDVPPEAFFRLPAEQRASLSRMARALDPDADLEAWHDDLAAMLAAELPVFSGPAALAIAVHAIRDLGKTEPLVRRLWEESGAKARLWILLAFSVLLKATPPEWLPLLEELTRRYVDEHRDVFLGPASRPTGNLDIVLLPLGLAYGKAGSPMPLFEELLKDALAKGDTVLAARIVAGLAAVGFYYPHALFDVLRPAFARLGDEAVAGALVTALATVRTLYADAVDHFLTTVDAPEAFRRQIDACAEVTLVQRYIRVLGFYNNAVYITLYYPRMRKVLSAGALELLATAPTPYAFITDHTLNALRMLRDANFDIREWTRPE